MMRLELEDAIEHVGEVEDEVLQLLEKYPEYVKSIYMLKAVNHLKFAVESLKCVRHSTVTGNHGARQGAGAWSASQG